MSEQRPGSGGHQRGHLSAEEWHQVQRIYAGEPTYLAYLAQVHGGGEDENGCAECQRRIRRAAAQEAHQ